MRDILFRGQIFGTKEWVSGYYYKVNDLEYIRWGQKIHQVMPMSVGQFTGLTDKNGVKVFEGDFVLITGKSYNVNLPTLVSWGKMSHSWSLKCVIDDKWVKVKYYSLPPSRNIEVVGNIMDNPELKF